MCVFVADPSLESDSDLGLVRDEANGGTQHLVFGALDGVSLDTDHLPADLLERQDLDQTCKGVRLKKKAHNILVVFRIKRINKY